MMIEGVAMKTTGATDASDTAAAMRTGSVSGIPLHTALLKMTEHVVMRGIAAMTTSPGAKKKWSDESRRWHVARKSNHAEVHAGGIEAYPS
jgi:hypothetical protein